ncbi:hypothetical protein BD324DRAFT_639326 [Kockovaella imperatae]|uniref:Bromodomain-containing protein n=1 Tax=Kockovaella imperatae TaxID=4999 RepID=A0A1Y1U6A5_9TREE|nr:hypothetical protein BD324DRAFT_639326 [Kockovaella imperatae]ORX33563.1 hypothetical protein BD324DRAFT_639326 [Kockovaella imperatae]
MSDEPLPPPPLAAAQPPVDSYAPPPLVPAAPDNGPPPLNMDGVNSAPAGPSYPAEPLLVAPPLEPSQPMDGAAAPLKPLLNPLQTGNSPMPSTEVEPPRSPNPANAAIDDKGNNVELDVPSASASVVGPAVVPPSISVERPLESAATEPVLTSSTLLPIAGQSSSAAVIPSPSPVPPPIQSPSSLPRDAPMPPTPEPRDEPAPVLHSGLIPPVVPAPTAITTEASEGPLRSAAPPPETSFPMSSESQAGPSQHSAPADSQPNAVAPVQPLSAVSGAPPTPPEDTPPVPNPMQSQTSGVPPTASDAMDVDVTAPPSSEPISASSSNGALKRSGDDLEGREEKRVKEEAPLAPTATPAAPTDAPAPALPPVDPNAPPPPWLTYTPPPSKPAGPTTPLTPNQHKHLLNAIRNLKKNASAINFLEPVDVVRFGIPHYAQIIDRPMDLGTVETKLIVSDPRGPPKDKSKMSKWDESKGRYGNVSDVVQDVRQIWENTRKFNGPTHVVSEAASKLETTFEKSLNNIPPEPSAAPAPAPPPAPAPQPADAGPSSHTRRPSVSQVPTIRRSSVGPDRPKREIHAPPSKELPYADAKPRRRNDSQLRWAERELAKIEKAAKNYNIVSPFLYEVEKIVEAFPQYSQVVKQPIDLNHIKQRLSDGTYDEVHQVDADMRLMFKNALAFNPPGDPVNDAAQGFKQIWDEKWKQLPAKVEMRDESEDPLAGDEETASDAEDTARLAKLESQIGKLQAEITDIKARQAARKASKPKKKTKPSGGRKSFSKSSPGANGHGGPKKSKKNRDMVFKDEEEPDSEEEAKNLTMSQKQELAEKINQVDESVLTKAVDIIKETMQLSSEQEIELDIELLPPRTIYRLYNLVCRGGRKAARAKPGQGKRSSTGKKAGGARKTVNEQAEEERIRRMEAQLQSFDAGRGGTGWDGGDESESSEDESSDED